MKLKNRTPEEMMAYVDGYNACNKLFRKYLKRKKTIEDAFKQMDIFAAVVNGIIDREVKDAD